MGKPTISNQIVLNNEFIVIQSDTQRIETSQYLEEKKANAIPLVAASEKGPAQTSFKLGLQDHYIEVTKFVDSRSCWEATPQMVKVQYMKLTNLLMVS